MSNTNHTAFCFNKYTPKETIMMIEEFEEWLKSQDSKYSAGFEVRDVRYSVKKNIPSKVSPEEEII